MQITNHILNNARLSFESLHISEKAREEIEYMGSSVKQYYEKAWQDLGERLEDTQNYDVVINEKLRPVFVEKTSGIELRNVRLRSKGLKTVTISANICDKTRRTDDSYLTLPNQEGFIFKTGENKIIEDCNDIFKMTKVLEAYKKS